MLKSTSNTPFLLLMRSNDDYAMVIMNILADSTFQFQFANSKTITDVVGRLRLTAINFPNSAFLRSSKKEVNYDMTLLSLITHKSPESLIKKKKLETRWNKQKQTLRDINTS